MRNRLLTMAPAAIGIAALVPGGGASAGGAATAAITSARLYIGAASQNVSGPGVKIKFTKSQADNDLARVVVHVPTGYTVNTTQATGTPLGTAAATVFARDLGAVVPVTGTVEVANQPDFAAQATACTGTATHTQIWALRLLAAGTPLIVPAFVDTVPAASPLSAFAVATIAVCFLPSDLAAGTPGRSPLGASLLTAEFTTGSISNPATGGEFRWRALATGYQTATGQPDPASTVEIQSLVDLPTTLSLKAKASKSSKRGVQSVSYSGSLFSAGKGVGSATIDVYKGTTQPPEEVQVADHRRQRLVLGLVRGQAGAGCDAPVPAREGEDVRPGSRRAGLHGNVRAAAADRVHPVHRRRRGRRVGNGLVRQGDDPRRAEAKEVTAAMLDTVPETEKTEVADGEALSPTTDRNCPARCARVCGARASPRTRRGSPSRA